MTKERLLQAINAHNSKTGLRDVIKAARATIKYCEDNEKTYIPVGDIPEGILSIRRQSYCVLAHAWKDGHKYASVGLRFADLGGLGISHKYSDVIKWFDSFSSDLEGAEQVLKVLEVKDG